MSNDLRARLLAAIQSGDVEPFPDLLRDAMSVLRVDVATVGPWFKVPRPSVERWLRSENLPHPVMRPVIFERLLKELESR